MRGGTGQLSVTWSPYVSIEYVTGVAGHLAVLMNSDCCFHEDTVYCSNFPHKILFHSSDNHADEKFLR